jgi:hypothetical protein
LNKFFLTSLLIGAIAIQANAQRHLTTDLLQEAENPLVYWFSGFDLVSAFSEKCNLITSATQFSYSAHDTVLNVEYSILFSATKNGMTIFHTPHLEGRRSNLFHSIVSPDFFKNSYVLILDDFSDLDHGYIPLDIADDDLVISTFSNYYLKDTSLIVSTTFVVPENTSMREIYEISRKINSLIKIL